MSSEQHRPLPRRWFFTRLSGGALAVGAALGAQPAAAQGSAPFAPVPHDADNWMMPGASKHRLFLDTTTVHGVASAVLYANNFLNASSSPAYGLADADSAVIIGVRSESVSFAFNDAMWAKYGAPMSEQASFTDPNTKQAALINVLLSADHKTLSNRGITLDSLLKRGVRLSVCQLATRALAGAAARHAGTNADDVYKELTGNLVASAHMVPAGIVALSRAQERGYTFTYVA